MKLIELGQGVFCFTSDSAKFGNSNVGLVIDPDGLTVIDSSATPKQGAAAKQAINELTAELKLPIKRVVLTSSQIVFSGGSQAFSSAAFYGSETASDQLDMAADYKVFQRLVPHLAHEYDDQLSCRPITHIVAEPARLSPSIEVFPLTGEAANNLVVRVESAGVVFAGALASFGVTPLGHNADFVGWIKSLNDLEPLAQTFVPGHGTPGSSRDLADFADYLAACINAKGNAAALAATQWSKWTDQHLAAVNVERAHLQSLGSDTVPSAMLKLIGLEN